MENEIEEIYFIQVSKKIPEIQLRLENSLRHCIDISKGKLKLNGGSMISNEINFLSANEA